MSMAQNAVPVSALHFVDIAAPVTEDRAEGLFELVVRRVHSFNCAQTVGKLGCDFVRKGGQGSTERHPGAWRESRPRGILERLSRSTRLCHRGNENRTCPGPVGTAGEGLGT